MVFEDNPFLQETGPKKESNIFIDLLQTVVIALSICVVIYLFIATPNEVHGQSMEPNFYDRELLLTNKTVQLLGNTNLKSIVGDYKRGDIVIFKHTLSQDDFIKRIIAVEGDTIMVKEGHVYVNDIKLNETYLPEGRRTDSGNFLQEGQVVKVPEGSYIVFGDNRGNSTDSRSNLVGFVKRNQLKGRVFFRYWPLNTFGVIRGHRYTELESSTLPRINDLLIA
ncbi:signal peptidase I [Candidatus Dojkabacteria bacterium]|nr:signal peptidase I [Candidatus Dojkabacteria bacterium]